MPDQEDVDAHFTTNAAYWRDVYNAATVDGAIYRERQSRALRWIDDLELPAGSRVLEVGCGAGSLSSQLADRRFVVRAIDSSEGMVEVARQLAGDTYGERLTVAVGDVHRLADPDDTYDLCVALGVLPWISDPGLAVRQMARVVRPGGHVLVTVDNRGRLSHATDPWLNPKLSRPRAWIRSHLRRRPSMAAPVSNQLHSIRELDQLLRNAGLRARRSATVGFGPFSLRGRPVLSERRGLRMNSALQRWSDRDFPVVRAGGNHYLVLATRSL